ncbi:MAG: MFS transporter, partial [Brevibacterium aurantiacum]
AFGLATLVASTLTKKIKPGSAPTAADSDHSPLAEAAAEDSTSEPPTMKLGPALRFASARPVPLFAMITIIAGQMMMTNVMVMTPVHMDHQEFSLGAIGIVVSVHIAGMYALSPVFGWMADRFGPGTVIASGVVVFATAITLGVIDAAAEVSSMVLLSTALIFLGVGWSMFLIGGSALLTASVPQHAKVTLQGASDAAMNLGGALMAGMAGTVLQAGGFLWINMMATIVLLIALAFSIRAVPLMRWPGREQPLGSADSTAEASYAD